MDDDAKLQVQRAEAVIALARLRLPPPEQDRVIAPLQAALAAVRRPDAEGQGADADQVARAEQKAAQAEADRQQKRQPYEADPLFMYLWRRGYGTGAYKASNLVRFFDRKVAHLIDFETARVNFTMLMELPERLREHAERMRGSGPAGADAVRKLVQAQRNPALQALTRQSGAGSPPEAAALLGTIAEIDAALSRHQPAAANE
jgi:hypothetical protein